jgi:menaquinone-specific isochorismate synthase
MTARPAGMQSAMHTLKLQTPEVDLLAWLEGLPGGPKLYWAARDGSLELAGWGVADEIIAADPAALLRKLQRKTFPRDPAVRYLGGLRFDPHAAPDTQWEKFGIGRFVLPEILLCRTAGRVQATGFSSQSGAAARLQKLLGKPVAAAATPAPRLQLVAQTPGRARWLRQVAAVTGLIRKGRVSKIVLARSSRFQLSSACSPWQLLRRLQASSADCCLFGFQPDAGATFLGATPERLYRRRSRDIESEALAGTRPRGRDTRADRQLGRDLLGDAKEREEHRLVTDAIAAALQPLCSRLEIGRRRQLRRLDSVQHLFTPLAGRLLGRTTDADLIRRLHPTPAVCGTPTATARRQIAALEPFDRGWYAGLVGWISAREAELDVAIRSGLLEGRTLRLYTGAGIVRNSDPAAEWDEVEHKLAGFLERLRHDA